MYMYLYIVERYIYLHSFHISKLMAEMSSVLGTVALDLHLTLR